MSIYFTSDLHFGHKYLCEGLRGMSAEESDALIINNWNSVINKNDKVFILGDISLDSPENIKGNLCKLKGIKEVVLGNHDTPRIVNILVNMGIKVSSSLNYHGFLLTHIPCHPNELQFYKTNIHGHIHNQGIINIQGQSFDYKEVNPKGKYYNVNVEFNNYTPVKLELIENYIK